MLLLREQNFLKYVGDSTKPIFSFCPSKRKKAGKKPRKIGQKKKKKKQSEPSVGFETEVGNSERWPGIFVMKFHPPDGSLSSYLT